MDEQKRLANVNAFIHVIGDHGRRFFHHQGRHGRMELDQRGRVWFIDHYSQRRIYTHYPYRWRGFTSGGTLKSLVELFRDHIKKGHLLNSRYFDHSPDRCGGHPWGYPSSDLEIVKDAALRLGIMARAEK
ncbi:hypothetical protein KUW00_15815 [Halomonas sp. DP5N14-9]|uniref:hypothetical protein n=1 Tax=Halomonas sp. DP5N14-9 TaxID=2859075 RepID=UPI001C991725|nr:hypothetical protein [Halomonas sp. DP5N14-9]MBY5942347.1 hypothetical protein [Halomonas sp. DP5N14-9]